MNNFLMTQFLKSNSTMIEYIIFAVIIALTLILIAAVVFYIYKHKRK